MKKLLNHKHNHNHYHNHKQKSTKPPHIAHAKKLRRLVSKLSIKRKRKILDKTNGVCFYCGVHLIFNIPMSEEKRGQVNNLFSVEHIKPITEGGTNELSNLVPACRDCNSARKEPIVQNDINLRWRLAWKELGVKRPAQLSKVHEEMLIAAGGTLPDVEGYKFWFEKVGWFKKEKEEKK